jgi:hypothetical protein
MVAVGFLERAAHPAAPCGVPVGAPPRVLRCVILEACQLGLGFCFRPVQFLASRLIGFVQLEIAWYIYLLLFLTYFLSFFFLSICQIRVTLVTLVTRDIVTRSMILLANSVLLANFRGFLFLLSLKHANDLLGREAGSAQD